MAQVLEKVGAGEGNRTLVISLEGFCSTIELHPRAATTPRARKIAHQGKAARGRHFWQAAAVKTQRTRKKPRRGAHVSFPLPAKPRQGFAPPGGITLIL